MDESIRRRAIVNEEESALERRNRKAEAKKLKRKRIEECGGIRPRNNKQQQQQQHEQQHEREESTKNNKQNKNRRQQIKKGSYKSGVHHRFGKVMESIPYTNKPRQWTLSIAIPGSIVSNRPTMELKTLLVGQIARAAAIYHVDEIIVYDDGLSSTTSTSSSSTALRSSSFHKQNFNNNSNNNNNKQTTSTESHVFMARLLQYCECPQYLRRHFFPFHPDLQCTGLMPTLDAPHHVRINESSLYREAVVVPLPYQYKQQQQEQQKKEGENVQSKDDEEEDKEDKMHSCFVNCGLPNHLVKIDRFLPPKLRCTVQIEPSDNTTTTTNSNNRKQQNNNKKNKQKLQTIPGIVVSPTTPRDKKGIYWGYTTRLASSLCQVFDDCPYDDNVYDLKIGTSERGDTWLDNHINTTTTTNTKEEEEELKKKKKNVSSLSSFHHALIVFGGVAGIEECVDADESMSLPGIDSRNLFDLWLNTCPFQGSRTIRTEEAILITLARLRPYFIQNTIPNNNKDNKNDDDDNNNNETKNDDDDDADDDDVVTKKENNDVDMKEEKEKEEENDKSTTTNNTKEPSLNYDDDEELSEESSDDNDD